MMGGVVAESIRRGLNEALVYAEGTVDESMYAVQIPEHVDIYGDSQAAEFFCVRRDPRLY